MYSCVSPCLFTCDMYVYGLCGCQGMGVCGRGWTCRQCILHVYMSIYIHAAVDGVDKWLVSGDTHLAEARVRGVLRPVSQEGEAALCARLVDGREKRASAVTTTGVENQKTAHAINPHRPIQHPSHHPRKNITDQQTNKPTNNMRQEKRRALVSMTWSSWMRP